MARAAHPPRPGDAGVTLIELLVVLVVIGVLAGAAALTVGQPGQRRDAAQEAALEACKPGATLPAIQRTWMFSWKKKKCGFPRM